jgi:ABC-type branched-subunit amino acid transport system substrate-binding protein
MLVLARRAWRRSNLEAFVQRIVRHGIATSFDSAVPVRPGPFDSARRASSSVRAERNEVESKHEPYAQDKLHEVKPKENGYAQDERRRRLAMTVLAVGLTASTCFAGTMELTEQEQAGQRIYTQGESPSDARISARIGMGGVELTGRTAACANCHGEDGRGRAEGGVDPLNIQWAELTKPYGHRHANGRSHAAFAEEHVRRAVVQGVDPDGNRLDGAMPRYTMSAKDFSSLVAYMKKLESRLDPGLTADAIRVGTLLPVGGRLAGLGESLRALWTAYFAQINERGGIHGRRLELVVQALPAESGEVKARARALLAGANVFAVLAPLAAQIEGELSDAAATTQVPIIGPLTLFPEDARASNQYVFHLLPGITELAQVLTRYAAQELKLAEKPIALWHPDTPGGRATAEAVEASLERSGWRAPILMPFSARSGSQDAQASAMKKRDIATVLVLGSGGDVRALAAAGARIGWTPHLLVPGPLVPRDIIDLPSAFSDRVFFAYATAPGDQRLEALREYATLVKAGPDTRAPHPIEIAAYSAGMLLVEGLKRTGRDLTRSKLVATLETVQGFDTGLIPQVSYNADRRIGALGGYLLALDLERKGLRPLGNYVRLP